MNILIKIKAVRVFTGSGLITGSDRIGPDRARNLPLNYFLKPFFIISMFVKYVYDHNNDVWIIGLDFPGRCNHCYKKCLSCFKSSGPEAHRIGPKTDQIAYFFYYLFV